MPTVQGEVSTWRATGEAVHTTPVHLLGVNESAAGLAKQEFRGPAVAALANSFSHITDAPAHVYITYSH